MTETQYSSPKQNTSSNRCSFNLSKSKEDQIIQPDDEQELKQLYISMTSQVDEGPFHETKYQKVKQDLSYKTEIHLDRFFEFFLYHFLFFFILGPFLGVFFIFKWNFFRNLGFWSCRSDTLFQMFLWIVNLSCSLTYFLTDYVSDQQIGFLWFASFLRTVIAGSKYASLVEDRIQQYKNGNLNGSNVKFDIVLFDWSKQTYKMKQIEIMRAMKRHDFDSSVFTLDFLVQPLEETIDELKCIDIEDQEANLFSGYKIISFLIQKFQNSNSPGYIQQASFLKSCCISFVLVVLEVPDFQLSDPNKIVAISFVSFALAITINCTFVYLNLEIYDMNRKVFLLDQAYYLITTKRTKCLENKLLPTINLINYKSLEAWSMLRSIVFDYGAIYHIRAQVSFSFIFLGLLVNIVASINIILGYYIIEIKLMILFSMLFGIFLILILKYLFLAAKVNSFFEEFAIQLENLKFIFQDIKRMKEVYKNQEPSNFIHKQLYKDLRFKDDIDGSIDKILGVLDDCQRHNEFDSRNYPFRLYGLKITFDSLQSFLMGLFTIYSFVVQQRLSQ